MPIKICVLLALIVCSCARHDDPHATDAPPAPTPTPAPISVTAPDLGPRPQLVDREALPDDYGFTATYAKLPFVLIQFYGGKTVLKVAKNHVQLSNEDIALDCKFFDQPLPMILYYVKGKKQKPDNFQIIACLVADQLVRPISNIDDMCEAFGCQDETIGEFAATRVLSDDGLLVEKSSHIRIQSGKDIVMTQKIAGAPKAEDFVIVETTAAVQENP